jgi:uncharacterized protein YxeA
MNKLFGTKKRTVITLLVVLLIAGGGYFAWHQNHKPKPLGVGEVNYGGPTEAEKKEAEDHKKQLEKDQHNSQSSGNAAQNATVVITYLSSSEARGYITNVLEDGGTCTITLTKGSSKVTASSTGIMDVNKTTCGPMSISPGQLTSGDWTAVLSYTSSKANGSSAPQKLSVP